MSTLKKYYVVTIQEAQNTDYATLEDDSFETSRKNLAGTEVILELLIPIETTLSNYYTHTEALQLMETEEWYDPNNDL